MRVGIVIHPLRRWAQQKHQWGRAEELGFDHAWTYDHLTWDTLPSAPWGATIPVLTAAATLTQRIRLGTWVASPNYRHPVPFAREIAGLDDISGGRAMLGVGAGVIGSDSRVLGGDALMPGERAARLQEFIHLLDLVLTQRRTSWRGRFFAAQDAVTTLPCIQQPRIPFIVAGNDRRTMSLAARYGAAWAVSLHLDDANADDLTWWSRLRDLTSRFDERLAETERDPTSVDRFLSLSGAPTFVLTSIDRFTDAIGRARALGFTDVVVHWPLPGAPVHNAPESILDDVAAALPSIQRPNN